MVLRRTVLAATLLAGIAFPSYAQTATYNVSLNTAPLTSSNYASPYALDFQFFDGGGTGPEPNNTARFSNFTGQNGTIASFSVSDGFPPGSGESIVNFTPGATLRFTVSLTTNADINSPGPDVLSFLLLSNGNTIATTDPSGGNTLVSFTEPMAASQGLSHATFEAVSGPLFTPTVTAAATGTPEPDVLALLLTGGSAMGILLSRRRKAKS